MNAARTRKGFTLIELLVVVMIILILAGIGVYAGRTMMLAAEKRRTQSTMKLILSAIQRYDETEKTKKFPDTGATATPADPASTNFYLLLANKDANQIVMSIPTEARLLHKAQKKFLFLFLDAWGKEMRYSRNGPGGSRQIESAGPDGMWGTSSIDERSDNINSSSN